MALTTSEFRFRKTSGETQRIKMRQEAMDRRPDPPPLGPLVLEGA